MPSNPYAKSLSAVLAVLVAASIAGATTDRREQDGPHTPSIAAPAENTAPRGSAGRLSGPSAVATGPDTPGR